MRRLVIPTARLFALAATLALAPQSARAATTFRMPTPEVRTLENGLQVAVLPDSRLPVVQVMLLVPAGSIDDPAGKAGAAYLTAEMLTHGTSSRTPPVYADELDRLGALVSATATRDYSTLTGSFLARDFEAGLEIMSDAGIHPSFDEQEFARVRVQTLRGLGQLRGNPANFAAEQIWAAVFEGHPYAAPTVGTLESLDRLDVETLRAFYGSHWRPDRATLAIAGDVAVERAFAGATEWFGRWEGHGAPVVERPFTPVAAPRPRIRVFDAPDLRDTELRFGLATPPRGHADETALTLAAAILGGGPSSRLGRLAVAGALGREARSVHVAQGRAGIFTIGLAIGRDSTGLAVRRVQDELRRLVDQPPDEAELAAARRVALNALPMPYETAGAVLSAWSAGRLHGLPESRYEQQRDRLEKMTVGDLAGALQRWIDPSRLVVVAVGPAAAIRPQLESLGDLEVVRLETPEAATAAPQPAPVVTPPSRQQTVRGREVVRKSVVAHGGLTRLRGIKDSVVEADAVLNVAGRELRGRMVQIRKEPWRMRFTTSIEGVETDQTLNGDRAWSLDPGRSGEPQEMDSVGVAGMRAGFGSDLVHLLLEASDPAARLASLGRRTIGDRETEAVEVRGRGPRRVLHFDPKTFQLVAMEQHEAERGGDFAARRIYGDFRRVQGVMWPFQEERWLERERVMKLTVARVVLDSGVDDSIFEKPEPELPPPAR